MKIPPYWTRLIFVEIVVICMSLFAVNLLVDFLDFSIHPAVKTPTPYFPHVFQGDDPTNTIFVKKFWAEILFFLLVFFGQISIFRMRKKIFTPHIRENG
jgi:hypothetical protein